MSAQTAGVRAVERAVERVEVMTFYRGQLVYANPMSAPGWRPMIYRLRLGAFHLVEESGVFFPVSIRRIRMMR